MASCLFPTEMRSYPNILQQLVSSWLEQENLHGAHGFEPRGHVLVSALQESPFLRTKAQECEEPSVVRAL